MSSSRAQRQDAGGGGGGGGWGWGNTAGRAAATAAADVGAAAPPRAGPCYWEAGPLSAAYDWRRFPNRIKVIKRVLALPLLDVQAFAWLDPRRALGAAGGGGNPFAQQRQRQPPRLFLASDDSWDSTASGGFDDDDDSDDGRRRRRLQEDGYEDGGGGRDPHSHRLHQERRRRRQLQQQQQQRRPAAAKRVGGLPQQQQQQQWFGCGVLCRDRLLKGLITVDPASRTLDYSKALPVSLGGAASLVLGASWRLDGMPIVPGQPVWRPALRVGLTTALRAGGGRVGGDGEGAGDTTRASATIRGSPLGSVHVRQTAFLDKRLGVEVVGDLSARLRPAAARLATAGAAAAAAVFADDEAVGGGSAAAATIPLSPEFFDSVCLHADVSEVNLVWRM